MSESEKSIEAKIKAINLVREQAYKLGEALSALRKIKNGDPNSVELASKTLENISDYGKNTKNL